MSFARRLLWPLAPIYATGVACKNARYDAGHATVNKLAWPVISIGNLSSGGTGKTPMVLLLAELLRAQGYAVDVLSRGYGRQSQQMEQVDPSGSAARYGDEPLQMARRGWRVFVGADRYRAGLLSEQIAGQTAPAATKAVHLLDDGFQHRRLARTVDMVLLTARDWQDTLLPAGNLREPISALRRASVIVLREEDSALQPQILRRIGHPTPPPDFWILRRSVRLRPAGGGALPQRPLAFSAIARPQDFLRSLRTFGCNYAAASNFRDHHAYTAQDMQQLRQRAAAAQADGFVTTEKDAVKLTPALLAGLAPAGPLALAELHVELLDAPSALRNLLARL
jgi:tetraacyldisaccharide 4'-kinase